MPDRFVLVRSAADLALVLEAAAAPLHLVSDLNAGVHAGAGWWRALVDQCPAERLAVALLDCGDGSKAVLDALAADVVDIVYSSNPAQPLARALHDHAGLHGARLWPERPEAFDLRRRRDPLGDCRRWLDQE
ncbi:hypothetical protein [Inquilinus sp. CAU 1745]|uniref:hypothetical protein n=1 Tax=Inquilinus sp. CAU 1745 TaxID=3140369 RepID=UPI00325B4575